MKYLTIRNVSPALAAALDREKKRRGTSLNQTVLDLLARALGEGVTERRTNGLSQFAGNWTDEEFDCFEAAVAVTEQIDEELWR